MTGFGEKIECIFEPNIVHKEYGENSNVKICNSLFSSSITFILKPFCFSLKLKKKKIPRLISTNFTRADFWNSYISIQLTEVPSGCAWVSEFNRAINA